MDLQSIDFKKAYSSDDDDILRDFYIPALENSIEYSRLAGYFSSTSLAVAARGILGLIQNGGEMRLIIAPVLTKDDLGEVSDVHKNPESIIERKILISLEEMYEGFIRDHVSALGWMIANQMLEIKVAFPRSEGRTGSESSDKYGWGIFHQKVAILKDANEHSITFSGSINETAAGWLGNIEEFKVFRSWEPIENEYAASDIQKFHRFWNNSSASVKVIELPEAVKSKLIEIAPDSFDQIDLKQWYSRTQPETSVILFPHQQEAIEAWLNNGMKGLFEMATGTGKTLTALGCVKKLPDPTSGRLIVIACPYQHLIMQWRRETDFFQVDYDDFIIADSSNPQWREELADGLIDSALGYKNLIIVGTTHSTFASSHFKEILKQYKEKSEVLLIADEVHGLGAEQHRKGLLDEYDLRLGLSATPKRWFDPAGTQVLYEYFNEVVYKFGLEEAINTINPLTGDTYLAPYRYEPRFTYLTADELQEYEIKSRRIAQLWNGAQRDEDRAEYLDLIRFERANIIKNALGKYGMLGEILDELNESIHLTIIYTSPQQISSVMSILGDRSIVSHRFSMEQGTSPSKTYGGISERDYLLRKFAEGTYEVLVAMRCLDEGVDIPPARRAILMSSSGNPREYIQRIGRVIRRYPGKDEATIFDIIILPPLKDISDELRNAERKILEKELKRYEEIASIAINNAEALALIYKVRNRILGD